MSIRRWKVAVAYNVFGLGAVVSACAWEIAPNPCYKLAAVYYTETLIEAVKKRI